MWIFWKGGEDNVEEDTHICRAEVTSVEGIRDVPFG